MREPRWPIAAGALVGVQSLLAESDDTHPPVVIRWLVGLTVAHDLMLVPVVLVVGVVVPRWAPARAWVAAGLVVSGSLSLVAWPLVRGYGRQAGNPSILPRDYGHGLAVYLVVVWLVTAALALLLRRRRFHD